MGDSGGGGGAAAAAAPSTAPARGASRASLLDQRKKEVKDAAVVASLVKTVYAEAWTNRAGAAMSSGYGKQVLKKKLCHIGDGDKPDGFDPSACQTYRDIDQFLAEPDEEKFFDAIKAYVVTCVVSCRVAKEAWFHSSNSCKKANTANMTGRDIGAALSDTIFYIQMMEKLGPAIWTLEMSASYINSSVANTLQLMCFR